MNKLPADKRNMILHLLVEGSSMRSITRLTGVSINTVTKLLIDAGEACAEYHDKTVRNVQSRRLELDEIWSFTYCKDKNTEKATKAPEWAGDTWTWTAIDADTKLIVSYSVGGRDSDYAKEFVGDVAERLATRVQLTTDGLKAYLEAVEGAFGADVDYAQLVKMYGKSPEGEKQYSPVECTGIKKKTITGDPDKNLVSTSYVERHNPTMRMAMRRFTRLTNAFSKRIQNHIHMLSLYFVYYNFCRIHQTLKVTPVMEAGITGGLKGIEFIGELIDARQAPPKKRGPYKKREISN
uniref:DDE domain-containing protein n=1 Tax=Candidatus Kentrum sp. UNK TaxID=2126344 RepID=A0A450ZY06_9GAMM|nr:MAG: hypothetical protein BECKUNK1418G_GA0071005_100434 [Candidatus Kentron sp. UNK]VFK68523.1 MAG: hypothetical protein BECKUNK1418H_GA0071006_100336 [Candidatus Kentron sp. UNK]